MVRVVVVGSAAATLSACIVAAAGAGAGGALYVTNRGVESIVPASIELVSESTDRVFAEKGIVRSGLSVDDDRERRVIRGKPESGDPDVTVEIETQDSGSTRIEVTARTSALGWDKDYARSVLERIVELSS
jgi:hypothetical protein